VAAQKNLVSSWDNAYRNYIERMADIEEHVELDRTTLYKNYNKEMFEQYSSNIENLIILENFLRKSNYLLVTAVQKASTSQQDADFNQRLII